MRVWILALTLGLVVQFVGPHARAQSQLPAGAPKAFIDALAAFGLGGEALKSALIGIGRRAVVIGQAEFVATGSSALLTKLHGARFIPELVREAIWSDPQLRAAVVQRLRSMKATANVTGEAARSLLRNPNSWRGLGRGGAASVHVVAAVATAIVAGTIGYAVGVRLLREKKQWDRQQQATRLNERYAHLVQRMLRQVRHGSAKLCEGMKFYEAATRLQINLQVSPGSPFAGVLCPVAAPSRCAQAPQTGPMLPLAKYKLCGAASTVFTSCLVTLCGTRPDVNEWIQTKRPDLRVKEVLKCTGRQLGCRKGFKNITDQYGRKLCVKCQSGRFDKRSGCCI